MPGLGWNFSGLVMPLGWLGRVHRPFAPHASLCALPSLSPGPRILIFGQNSSSQSPDLMFTKHLLSARHLACVTSFHPFMYNSYPPLTSKETEAQRGQMICPRSHSWWVDELGF